MFSRLWVRVRVVALWQPLFYRMFLCVCLLGFLVSRLDFVHSATAQSLPAPTPARSGPLVAPPRNNTAPLPPISPAAPAVGQGELPRLTPTPVTTAVVSSTGTISPTTISPTTISPTTISPTTSSPTIGITRPRSSEVILPTTYRAQGSFASQTTFTDGTTTQQQGSFTITHAAITLPVTSAIAQPITMPTTTPITTPITLPITLPLTPTATATMTATMTATAGALATAAAAASLTDTISGAATLPPAAPPSYAANASYSLTTRQADGGEETMTVYQVDDYIAVSYGMDDWAIVRREQGSSVVAAIQPISDLARAFPRVLNNATAVAQEVIAGIPTTHFRLDDPPLVEVRLIRPLLAISGEIRSLQMDAWVADVGNFVVRYRFQVEIAGATVLDANAAEVQADQNVTWTYELSAINEPLDVGWPPGAPQPGRVAIPGFAPGTFPIPPDTELISIYNGIPELVTQHPPEEVAAFYRLRLVALGWLVAGGNGLLSGSKEQYSFQLLLTPDEATGGTRLTLLPGPEVGGDSGA